MLLSFLFLFVVVLTQFFNLVFLYVVICVFIRKVLYLAVHVVFFLHCISSFTSSFNSSFIFLRSSYIVHHVVIQCRYLRSSSLIFTVFFIIVLLCNAYLLIFQVFCLTLKICLFNSKFSLFLVKNLLFLILI